MASKLKRFVYKEVLPGDLRKAEADSNDADSGGGARDLRFRPWNGHFEDVVAAMAKRVDQTKGRDRYYVELVSIRNHGGRAVDEVTFWPPTNARPDEGRLANVDRVPAFAVAEMPPASDGRAMYFIWEDDDAVYGTLITEKSLRSGAWHSAVAEPILKDLQLAEKTVRGYVDLETGRSAFSHTLP
jgi:hypothetical protein